MLDNPIKSYLAEVESSLRRGDSTEHTHRPALAGLIESCGKGIKAVNEPARIECGAPDLLIAKGPRSVGYIEAKDVGKSLGEAEKTGQWERYRNALHNLVLTDYLEFRWYTDGEPRASARLGTTDARGKVHLAPSGIADVWKLLEDFLAQRPEPIGSPKALAGKMARVAQMVKDLIENTLTKESGRGSLHQQLDAFRENLIPDLKPDQFADMYAQTIAYGLFAARCNVNAGREFVRRDAAYLIPKTNPFLRNIFGHIAGPELDERIAWLVDDLVGLLADADMAAILNDFGVLTGRKDPVVHFYETFLSEYDPKLREMRGVYYTPEEVVSYIVRSVDWLLKNKLKIPDGLADKDALILDPAAGTATFLYEVINEIYNSGYMRGRSGTWDGYVSDRLLPRIFGFELLMAPYAIAHLKLALQLKETGYAFEADQRLGIYLTNTLEEAIKHSDLLLARWLTDEANSAAVIKKDKPVMVVLGNPPYSGHSANKGEWITRLINAYKTVDGMPLGERNPKWLQDDYVKFIRFGQWRIDRTGQGILAFITNHGYLDNPTFRGMRQSLMETFDEIYVYDLHGNSKKKERTPEGGKDENVFDIQQGVTISLMVKKPLPSRGKAVREAPPETAFSPDIWNRPITASAAARTFHKGASKNKKADKGDARAGYELAKIYHADIWGLRKEKYERLLEEDVSRTKWRELTPHTPDYLFVPRDESLLEEYKKGWKVTEIMPVNVLGFQTHRDNYATDFDEKPLRERITALREAPIRDEELRREFKLGKWDIKKARGKLQSENDWEKSFITCQYRPFDNRYCFYNDAVMDRPRKELVEHVAGKYNICLNTVRQTKMEVWGHAVVSDSPTPAVYVEIKDGSSVFPLYLHETDSIQSDMHEPELKPNMSQEFIKTISGKLNLKFLTVGAGDDEKVNFGPEDVFNYMYAVFHSPTYRKRYAEFLKSDFPRLPLTSDKELFFRLADKGSYLVDFHLLVPEVFESPIAVGYTIRGASEVEKVSYDEMNKRVYINGTQYFEGVEKEVWDFHVGGYRVCEKWLKDRKGRNLTVDDVDRYGMIVAALKETIRLMGEIDALIEEHGGWPIR